MSQNIESTLHENRHFAPTAAFVAQANLTPAMHQALTQKAQDDYEGFWGDLAQEKLQWNTPFTQVLNSDNAPHYQWFQNGKINIAENCIDRHLESRGNKKAIIFQKENDEVITYTYKQLHDAVNRFANGLKSLGVTQGDRVIIYMPMIAEGAIAMLACARIGAIHSVVFGGFSAQALRDRVDDAGAKVIITADASMRGGKQVPLKDAVDEALAKGGTGHVEKVIVLQYTKRDIQWHSDRDIWWHDLQAGMSNYCDPVYVDSEHPLFLLYTSGSTGKPKGIQHSSAGYLLNAQITNEWVFDLKDEDVFWCTADIGWITGHTYVVYGPLAAGGTVVIYEGIPTYPDAGRFWQLIERHRVSIFYTAPTAIRALMKFGEDLPNKYDLSSIRLLGTVGEPINPEAWMWYHTYIGREHCPIVDTWWQTETGANMIAPLPGIVPTKPGSCTLPLPGIMAAIVDNEGHEVTEDHQGGALVIKKPWPSMLRNIWGDHDRYVSTYFSGYGDKGYYVVGDGAMRDEEGYFWIMGRLDDVLNVSGHRLGTMEIESALVAHPRVAEAAVVGRPHDIKGEAIVAFVVVKGTHPCTPDERKALVAELREWVSKEIGPIAKPDDIRFGDNLPKTRSGKIMRRLLRTLAKGEQITSDTSTLENPQILEQFQQT